MSQSRFIILAYPRTGSYTLTSLLDSCHDVSCYGEVFKADRIELKKFRQKKHPVKTAEERDSDPLKFVALLARQTPRKIFGFKVFTPHLRRLPALERSIRDGDWKRIILYRDPVEIYASTLRAEQTSVWTHKANRKTTEDVLNQPVTFEEESFENFLGNYRNYLDYASSLAAQGNAFVLSYKQIGDPPVMARLLEFVGSTAAVEDLRSEYQKQFTRPLDQGFTNWSELVDHLAKVDLDLKLPDTTVAE